MKAFVFTLVALVLLLGGCTESKTTGGANTCDGTSQKVIGPDGSITYVCIQ